MRRIVPLAPDAFAPPMTSADVGSSTVAPSLTGTEPRTAAIRPEPGSICVTEGVTFPFASTPPAT